MNWPIVTGVVAIYGAMLSSWNAYSSYRAKRRSINVEVSYGCETYQGGEWGPQSIIVTALNKGHQPITLAGAGIRWPDGRTSVCLGPSGNTRFPHELDGGKSCMVCLPIREIVPPMKNVGFSGKVRLKGFFRDALGKTYAKKFNFDLEDTSGIVGE